MNNYDIVEENRNSKLFDGVLVTIDTKQALAHNRSVTDGSNYSTPRKEDQNRETANSPDQVVTSTFALDRDTHDVTKNIVLLISIISASIGVCLTTIAFFCFWNFFSFVKPDCKEASVCKKLMCCKKRDINTFSQISDCRLSDFICSKHRCYMLRKFRLFGKSRNKPLVKAYREALDAEFLDKALNKVVKDLYGYEYKGPTIIGSIQEAKGFEVKNYLLFEELNKLDKENAIPGLRGKFNCFLERFLIDAMETNQPGPQHPLLQSFGPFKAWNLIPVNP